MGVGEEVVEEVVLVRRVGECELELEKAVRSFWREREGERRREGMVMVRWWVGGVADCWRSQGYWQICGRVVVYASIDDAPCVN